MPVYDSVDKIVKYISIVAKKPFEYKGKVVNPPEQLFVSESFWREYRCKANCGGCCRYLFTLDWLPGEWEDVIAAYPQVEVDVDCRSVPKREGYFE